MNPRTHITKFLLLLLILGFISACSKNRQTGTTRPPSEKIYPHPEEFKTATHGLSYYTDKDICWQCHVQKVQAAGEKDTSCTKCHENFPHKFQSSHAHAEGFFKDRDSCKLCHGDDYAGGNSKKSCKKCHNFPHESPWALPKKHGEAYLAKTPEPVACTSCHDKKGSLANNYNEHFVACDTCHIQVPHSFENQWGHSNVAKTYSGKCNICHTYSEESNSYRLFSEENKAGCKTAGCHDKATGNTPKFDFP